MSPAARRLPPALAKDILLSMKAMLVDPNDGMGWHRAMRAVAAERKDLLQLVKLAGYDRHPAASLCIDARTGGNLVAFRSGQGMGATGCTWGTTPGERWRRSWRTSGSSGRSIRKGMEGSGGLHEGAR